MLISSLFFPNSLHDSLLYTDKFVVEAKKKSNYHFDFYMSNRSVLWSICFFLLLLLSIEEHIWSCCCYLANIDWDGCQSKFHELLLRCSAKILIWWTKNATWTKKIVVYYCACVNWSLKLLHHVWENTHTHTHSELKTTHSSSYNK